MTFRPAAIAALMLPSLLILAAPALAQSHQGHQGHGATATPATASPSTTAYKAANDKMHKDMGVAFTGNADVDFMRGMIPHHQGAIDMARIVLAHGKDPEVKKLAQEVVAAQEKEIAFMRAWLKKNDK